MEYPLMNTSPATFTRRSLVASILSVTAFGATTRLSIAAHDGMHEDEASASPQASPEMAMANTGTGAAYLTIANNGDTPDRLVSGMTEVAQTVQIHEMKMDNGVMKMAELPDGLEIPTGGEVTFEPSGYHLMLINLTQNLEPDSSYLLHLTFAQAGDVDVTVAIGQGAPDDQEPTVLGDLTISGAWSRPAPMITVGLDGTPVATPEHHH
jgi:copper(I)-binding protein